jgi:hypothetical protein
MPILNRALRFSFRRGLGCRHFRWFSLLAIVLSAVSTRAQDNYEIQVYASELVLASATATPLTPAAAGKSTRE